MRYYRPGAYYVHGIRWVASCSVTIPCVAGPLSEAEALKLCDEMEAAGFEDVYYDILVDPAEVFI